MPLKWFFYLMGFMHVITYRVSTLLSTFSTCKPSLGQKRLVYSMSSFKFKYFVLRGSLSQRHDDQTTYITIIAISHDCVWYICMSSDSTIYTNLVCFFDGLLHPSLYKNSFHQRGYASWAHSPVTFNLCNISLYSEECSISLRTVQRVKCNIENMSLHH